MKIGVFLLFCAVGMIALACGSPQTSNQLANTAKTAASPDQNAPPSADLMAEGRSIYTDKCAACHKENGKGGKIEIEGKSIKPEDLTADKIKAMSDDRLYSFIFRGIEDDGMPAFKDDLSEAQIREVVRYMRSELQKMPLPEPTKRIGGVD